MSAVQNLTRREKQVFECLIQGKYYKEIGAEKLISVNTVKKHIKNIYRKLGTHKRKLLQQEYRNEVTAEQVQALA